MVFRRFVLLPLIASLVFSACKKEKKLTGCFADAATVRVITNKQAGIRLVNNTYYIVEQGSIDTQLKPCNLPPDFQVDGLSVTITGETKATFQNTVYPCCIEDFVIETITR